jgi:aryl carrier-like protein
MNRLQEFARLALRKRELEAELREVQDQMARLEAELVEEFVAAGLQHVRVGGLVVYLTQEVYAAPVNGDHERLAEALARLGLDDLVATRVDHVRLSAWVRELRRQGEEIPAELAELIKVSEVVRLRTRKV